MDIHVAREGQQLGAYPLEEVRRQLAGGILLPTDLAWTDGAASWVPLASFPGVASDATSSAGGAPPLPKSLPPPAPVHLPPSYPMYQPRTSGAAIASLVCGILGFLLVPIIGSIVAIICGHSARTEIRNANGEVGGDGMAIGGLIMGYLSLAFFGLAIAFFAVSLAVAVPFFKGAVMKPMTMPLPTSPSAKRKTDVDSLVDKGETIAAACQNYAADHQGNFPKTLDELWPNYLKNRGTLGVRPFESKKTAGFEYFGGTTDDPPKKVLLISRFNDEGKRVVVRVDGSAAFEVPPENLRAPDAQ